ncbi:MAG: hypothetical protein AAGD38_06215 [Acidobacteriota bacterium]
MTEPEGSEALLLEPGHVDLDGVARALETSGVATAVPPPGIGQYVGDVLAAFGRFVESVVHKLAPGGMWLADMLGNVGPAVLATIILLILVGVGFLVARRLRRETGETVPVDVSVRLAEQPESTRINWRAELEKRLAAGSAPSALEALWWWLADRLVTAPQESWTSSQLVRHAGRPDLLPAIRDLDRLRWGATEADIASVRHLHQRLDPMLDRSSEAA